MDDFLFMVLVGGHSRLKHEAKAKETAFLSRSVVRFKKSRPPKLGGRLRSHNDYQGVDGTPLSPGHRQVGDEHAKAGIHHLVPEGDAQRALLAG